MDRVHHLSYPPVESRPGTGKSIPSPTSGNPRGKLPRGPRESATGDDEIDLSQTSNARTTREYLRNACSIGRAVKSGTAGRI